MQLGIRGGVEDTKLEAKAKDTKKSEVKDGPSEDKPSRGQGQKCSRPKTQAQVFPPKKTSSNFFFRRFPKKKSLQHNFSGDLKKKRKVSKKIIQVISRREKHKRSSQIFREVTGVFQQNCSDSKNSAVLDPGTGQFSSTWGFEAKAKDFTMCARGKGRPWGLHLCKGCHNYKSLQGLSSRYYWYF